MKFEGLRNFATSVRIYHRNRNGRKFEPEAPYMREAVKGGDTCLHLGGSDGRHSYLLAQWIGPDGHVHVYEPSNYSFAILERLIRWHGLTNVTPHNLAIGAERGEQILSVPTKLSGHLGRAYGVVGRGGRTASEENLALSNATEFVDQNTQVVTLDDVMADENLKTVDFIRCDIEGSEINLIRGGRMTLETHLPSLLIEIHPFSLERNFRSSAREVRDYFLNLGYRMWQMDPDDTDLIANDEIDATRRWKDYFLVHPSRADRLPPGRFREALAKAA